MSTVLSELGGTALSTVGETVAFTASDAAHRTLDPLSVAIAQAAWHKAQVVALDAVIAAEVAAERVDLYDAMALEATYSGFDAERFKNLYDVALNAPGTGELLTLLRRGEIDAAKFRHGLNKARLEPEWEDPLLALQDARLDPAVIAAAIVRGLIPDPGILPVGPPAGEGRVPRFPTFNVDAATEAKAAGLDLERLSVLVGNYGRPASPEQAARAEWRGVIDHTDYLRAIAEGDVRNEWAGAIFEAARAIPTPTQYEEGALRGIITNTQADAGAAKHGMTQADARFLFELQGRPLNVHEITTGLARGGTYGGDYSDLPEPYQDAIRRSAIRPEYAHLAYANRYTYPSAFVLRALAQAGELGTADDVAATLEDIGWKPDFAAKVAKSWVAAPHVSKAQTQLWTTTHSAYVNHWITDDDAAAALTTAGVDPAATGDVLDVWKAERNLRHAGLAAAQIKKALALPDKNKEWAIGRLEQLGWDADDATIFLDE